MARKNDILSIYTKEVESIREAGLFKGESPIVSSQGAHVLLADGREVLNMCANNYLGLGNHPRMIEAAKNMEFIEAARLRDEILKMEEELKNKDE